MFIDKDNLTIVKKRKKVGKELTKVIANIRLIVEAGEAKPVAPIAPIMGLYQLNAVDFCKRFNEMTKNYELGFPVSVLLKKKSDNKLDIILKAPLVIFLLWVMCEEGENSFITIEELYDIVRIRNYFDIRCVERNILNHVLNLIGREEIILEDELL